MSKIDPYFLLCAAHGREISLDAMAQPQLDAESGEYVDRLDRFLWQEGLYVTAETHLYRREFAETIQRTRARLQKELETLNQQRDPAHRRKIRLWIAVFDGLCEGHGAPQMYKRLRVSKQRVVEIVQQLRKSQAIQEMVREWYPEYEPKTPKR